MIDLTNFRRITGGNKDLEKELFNEFIQSSTSLLQTLKTDINNQDHESWKKNAHALKGIALNLGAHSLAEIAKKGMEMNNEDNSEKINLLNDLETSHKDVLIFLDNEMH